MGQRGEKGAQRTALGTCVNVGVVILVLQQPRNQPSEGATSLRRGPRVTSVHLFCRPSALMTFQQLWKFSFSPSHFLQTFQRRDCSRRFGIWSRAVEVRRHGCHRWTMRRPRGVPGEQDLYQIISYITATLEHSSLTSSQTGPSADSDVTEPARLRRPTVSRASTGAEWTASGKTTRTSCGFCDIAAAQVQHSSRIPPAESPSPG